MGSSKILQKDRKTLNFLLNINCHRLRSAYHAWAGLCIKEQKPPAGLRLHHSGGLALAKSNKQSILDSHC